MNPSEFSSLVHDVALTAANFDNGAFGDAVQGPGYWAVNGATPVFETRAGLEGMVFGGSASFSVIAPFLALHEATIIVTAQPATGTQPALIGGTYTAGNSWRLYTNGATLRTFSPPGVQAATDSDPSMATRPTVFAGGFSPATGRLFAQVNDGALAVSEGNGKEALLRWSEAAIGQHRTSYLTGWVAQVQAFSRCLPERDPAGFASLMANRMAQAGI